MRKCVIALLVVLLLTSATTYAADEKHEFTHKEAVDVIEAMQYPGNSFMDDLAVLEALAAGNKEAVAALSNLRAYLEASCDALILIENRVNGITSAGDGVDASVRFVWLPESGVCYHDDPRCSKMSSTVQVTMTEAVRLGYRACKKCVGY